MSVSYRITSFTMYSRSVIAAGFASVDDAIEFLGGDSKIVLCEHDDDNRGFWDLYTTDNRVLAIEPAEGV